MRRLWRWWWVIVLAPVVAVVTARIALPGIVRRQIEQRASDAIHARVTVGNVQLALVNGGVALENVAVRALDAAADAAPLIAWERLGVYVRWRPLLHKTVQLASVDLVGPDIALDRLHSGELNLAALIPHGETPATEEKPAAPATPWQFGIDHLSVTHGNLQFRDLFIPKAEPMAIALQTIEVDNIALGPGLYGKPADIRFATKLDQGAARTHVRFTRRAEGFGIDLTLAARGLPLHRSRVYVPGVAWSDLNGLLSLDLRYRLETGRRNDVTGDVRLDDLKIVWVSGLDDPALAWKTLGIRLDKVDLTAHDARIAAMKLTGAALSVRPGGPEPVPILAAMHAAERAKKADALPAPKDAPDAAPPAKKPHGTAADAKLDAPWKWSIASIEVDDSLVRLLSTPPRDVGVTAHGGAVTNALRGDVPVTLGLAVGEGKATLDGTLRITPIGFSGHLTTEALSLPELAAASGAVAPDVLEVGKLTSNLDVAVGSVAPTPGDARVHGDAAIDGLWVQAHDPQEFAAGAKRIEIGIDELTLPGVLAPGGAGSRVIAARLTRVDLAEPYARVMRTANGIVLPEFKQTPAAPAKDAPAPAPADTPAADTPPAATPAAGPKPTLRLARFTIEKGHVDLTDRTVSPFYWGALTPIDADIADIRWPEGTIEKIALRATSAPKGLIEVTGRLAPDGVLELTAKDLPLARFNPYVTAASPYSIADGVGFLTTKVKYRGNEYDTTTDLTLWNFNLASRTGQHVVIEQLGIPLTVALALLRDWKGNIDLSIPVGLDERGTQIGMGTIIRNAVVRALSGAITSPLRLAGAFLGGHGDHGEAVNLLPTPIAFRPGTATLDARGDEAVERLAAFIASRPGLAVTLSAPPTTTDVRGLREQALLKKVGPSTGIVSKVRNVGARGRIVTALEARAKGEPGTLDADDEKALDEMLADIPAPSAADLRALGDARMTAIETRLRERYGLRPDQMRRAKVEGEPGAGEPAVLVELGSL